MWRNGYAPVCKTVYSGSIPDVASISPLDIAKICLTDRFGGGIRTLDTGAFVVPGISTIAISTHRSGVATLAAFSVVPALQSSHCFAAQSKVGQIGSRCLVLVEVVSILLFYVSVLFRLFRFTSSALFGRHARASESNTPCVAFRRPYRQRMSVCRSHC
jgi:hypothetical protein